MQVIRWNGEPISTPGVFSGVPMSSYHDQLTVAPSISSSGLRTIFAQSPAHYFTTSYLNPNREEQKDSRPLVFGRGAHHLLLGEAEFAKHFVIRPENYPEAGTGKPKPWSGNSTWCKDWLAAVRGEGKTVILPTEVEHIKGMAERLAAEPLIQAGVLNGEIERSIVYQDEDTGVWIKVRPDAIPTDALDLADLKTAADVTDDALENSIGAYGYHMQGALAGMACRAVLGREMSSFSLVFVEKEPPYCVRVKTLKPADLELGERQVRLALRAFAKCLETGRWPGPGGEQTDAEYVELKPYHRSRIEQRLAVLEQEIAA